MKKLNPNKRSFEWDLSVFFKKILLGLKLGSDQLTLKRKPTKKKKEKKEKFVN
jgi:hypothetical protein